MQVFKFGGASVKDAEGVKNLASIVKKHGQKDILIVISAMGKTTNALEDLTKAYIAGDDNCHQILESIKAYHFNIMESLFSDHKDPVYNEVANAFVEIEWLVEEPASDPADYIYDQIVSVGELLSTKIVAAYLNLSGIFSIWSDARNYIKTDNNYKDAQVDWVKTQSEIDKHLPQFLDKGVVITQGFVGSTSENFSSTLGREGSDYSGAIFSACLNATSLTIWKDVPGVLNADPKWFDETEKIEELSYHDAIELTYYGATVIHPKTIKPLQNKEIPLFVRSFLAPDEPGTKIWNVQIPLPIPSFIFKINQVLISIFPKDFSFIIEENLSEIFNIFHKNKVKVNTMFNSAISFSVSVDYSEKTDRLLADLSEKFKVKYNSNLELVTIRYYNADTIARVTIDKEVLLEVKSRHTCQMVMKNKETL